MPEVRGVTALFFFQPDAVCVRTGEAWEAKEVRGPRLVLVIDTRDPEPQPSVLFNEDEMAVIVITVQQENVLGQRPEAPGKKRDVFPPDLSGRGD